MNTYFSTFAFFFHIWNITNTVAFLELYVPRDPIRISVRAEAKRDETPTVFYAADLPSSGQLCCARTVKNLYNWAVELPSVFQFICSANSHRSLPESQYRQRQGEIKHQRLPMQQIFLLQGSIVTK